MTVAVPGLTPSSEDAAWMRRCAERSQQAAAAGNTPVGALLVVDGRVLAEAAAPCLRCGYAIREARLERVVVGRPSGDTGSLSPRFPILSATGVDRWDPPPEIARWTEGTPRKVRDR